MPGRAVITRRGNGPDLVLVHGWAMHARIWGGFADRLAEAYTLHLVDLPGHGEARGEGSWRLEEVVDQLLEETPTAPWLGWSLGGLVALRAAWANPAHVESLVLIGVNPCFVAGPGWPDAMPIGTFEAFEAGVKADPQASVSRFHGLMVAGTSDARRTLAVLRELALTYPLADIAALQAGLDLLRHVNLTASLPGLTQRSLWVAGAADRRTQAICSMRAASLMARAEFRLVEDAGHAPFLSHPGQVLNVVRGFLAMEMIT